MPQPILGTGLSGLVGSALVKHLQTDYDFHNLDLKSGVDITDRQSVNQAIARHPAPVLLHLAAFTNVNAAQEQNGNQSGLAYQVNVEGTRHIAQACRDQNIHLIHFSTGYVFDGQQNEPYQENDPLNPTDWYSQTKAWAEDIVQEITPSATIVRINFPYRQDEFAKADIWHKMADALQEGKTEPFFNDHFFTLTPVEWLVPVVDWMIKNQPFGIFHATTDHVFSDFTLAEFIAQSLKLNPQLEGSSVLDYNRTADRPYQPSLVLSNQKLKKAMGDDFPQHETQS